MATYLEVNLRKIEENAARVVEVCSGHGVEVLGVTKGFSAIPEIVRAMVEGGIKKLADARLENAASLRLHGFTNHITLLRIPMISRADRVVSIADCSLNSEEATLKALSDAAVRAGKLHEVVLMLELGDLREGMFARDALRLVENAGRLPGLRITGVGTNMGCYGGILPTKENLSALCRIGSILEDVAGGKMEVISGGGTSSLILIAQGAMPAGINQIRVGEGILLGTDTTHNMAIPWLHQNAFVLHAEIVEVKSKPSVPFGETGFDAFGNRPVFKNRGVRRRAIIALGKQDTLPEGLIPLDFAIEILGASSDHMILDIEDAGPDYKVGDMISFRPNYQGMLQLCGSKYVKKEYVR